MEKVFTIRLVQDKDMNELLELHHLLFPVKYTMKTMNSFLKQHYLSLVLTVKEKGKEKIIGVSVTRRRWVSFFSTDRFGYLCTFGIHSDYRQKHFATDLLHVTCKILKNHFLCSSLSLHMQKINEAAYKFYINFGFKAIEILPQHYSLPDEESTAVYMIYNLKDNVSYDNLNNQISIDPEVQLLFTEVPPLSWFSTFNMEP